VTAAFRAEMAKQVRRPRTYIALGITIALPVIIAIALHANPPRGRDEGDSLLRLATQTGLIVPAATLRFMSRFFLIVIVALFAGDAVASEATWGTLRYLLIRPVGRGRLLAAKLGAAALFALLATVLIAVAGLVAGTAAFGWEPLSIPFFVQQGTRRLVEHLLLATGYVAWSMAAIVAFGFMLSTMVYTPAGAIFGAVGLGVVSEILDSITAIGSIRYGFPTHYIDSWDSLYFRGHASADMARGALLQVAYVVVFCAFAAWWFRRKDILS